MGVLSVGASGLFKGALGTLRSPSGSMLVSTGVGAGLGYASADDEKKFANTLLGGIAGAGFGIGLNRLIGKQPSYIIAPAIMGASVYGMNNVMSHPYDQGAEVMAEIARQTGVSSTGFDVGQGTDTQQSSRQRWIASTAGLTQGLHRNRH